MQQIEGQNQSNNWEQESERTAWCNGTTMLYSQVDYDTCVGDWIDMQW